MTNRFQIEVQAIDKFSGVFRKLNTTASTALRPALIAQRQFASLGKEMHLDKIASGFRSVSSAAINIGDSLGLAAGPMRAVFGLGAAGGIAATAYAVGKLTTRWGNLGFEVNRTANATGYSTDTLQKYIGAAKLAGVSSEAITDSMAGVARTMQDIRGGRADPKTSVLANMLGIKENDSNEQALGKLSDALHKVANPQLRDLIAQLFGMNIGSMPLLSQGQAAVSSLEEKAAKLGLVMSPAQIAQANNYKLAMLELDAAFSGLANTLGSKLGPSVAKGLSWLNRQADGGGVSGLMDLLGGKATFGKAFGGGGSAGGGVASNTWDVLTGKINGQTAWKNIDAGAALPRGLRTNNPGNLRIPGSATGFQTFDTPQLGLNAMAQQIGRYQNRDGLNTIGGIVSKYAPSSENNTGAYIGDVSRQTGFDPNARIDVNDPKVLAPLLSAMVKHENGSQPFSADQLNQAAQSVQIHVNIGNAPPGTRVTTTGAPVASARISYALPSDGMP